MKKWFGSLLAISLLAYSVYSLLSGVGIIVIENVEPEVLSIKLYDYANNPVPNGSALFLDDARNNYKLVIEVRDNNTVRDLYEVYAFIYSPDCANLSSFDKQFCYGFKWTPTGFYELSSTGWTNISLLLHNASASDVSDTIKRIEFQIKFPKVARHYNSPNWTIKVVVFDHTTNVTKEIKNYFDFNYYAEFAIDNTTLQFSGIALGSNTTEISLPIKVIAVNYDSKLYVWSNTTYLVDKYGNPVNLSYYDFEWPISYVYVNGQSLNTTQKVLATIPAGTENTNYTLAWKVYIPENAIPGTYRFYYFVDIAK